MKVAIITIHGASNQGACLQAYALQEYMSDMGYDVNILDYHCKKAEEVDYVFNINGIKNMRDLASQLIYMHRKAVRNKKFRIFREKNMKLTDSYTDMNQMKHLESEYDCFCVGSDQVWNPKITNRDETFLLKFVEDGQKKVSFASSFGIGAIDDVDKIMYVNALKEFKSIGVREETAKQMVEELVKKEADVVIDPTLLLNFQQWNKVSTKISVPNKYILIYQIRKSSNLSRYAIALSDQLGIPVLKISESYIPEKGIKHLKGISPDEFLYLFQNAEVVVTNSFHGTAFSVNFNKEFYAELSPEKKNGNSRIIDFLDKYQLSDRIIGQGEEVCKHVTINWDKVNGILEQDRVFAIEYIRKAIEG